MNTVYYGNRLFVSMLAFLSLLSCNQSKTKSAAPPSDRPNILFAIADDAAPPYFGPYGTGSPWLKTPNIDRVARHGILFMNAYTPNGKCAPSRATIITGRNSWQLGNAANHWNYFPKRFKTYAEALRGHGYFTGQTGKGWAPGIAGKVNGHRRWLTGKPYDQQTTSPPTHDISANDYAANFKQFLDDRPEGKPFCFWYGAHEPHRGYIWRSGIEKGDMNPSQIKYIPKFLPDNDTVRTDLLDYGFEVEHFDKHLGRMLELLKQRGELRNTLVVVTGDNGIPFPGAKGQQYQASDHVGLAVMWPAGIKNSGRKVTDFVSFIDLAPTFLDVAGVAAKQTGMQRMEGRSLADIFSSGQSGRVDSTRDYVLVGKERHDVGRPHDWGYPIRAIITDNHEYTHNFKPDRWPAGNPETGYPNIDHSPTKTWVLDHRKSPKHSKYWYHAMGKRPADELYRMNSDSANMDNLLTGHRENRTIYSATADSLHKKMFDLLKTQGDPRLFGHAQQAFYGKPYADPSHRNFYERYMKGELTKKDAGWVNPSDFESKHPMKGAGEKKK